METFSTVEEFENWKKDKKPNQWKEEHIQFKCSKCSLFIEIRAKNLLDDFICRSCRKSLTESKKTKEQKEKENQKRKNTLKERHGIRCPIDLDIFKEKYKQTCLQKYGVESTNQVKNIIQKQSTKRKEIWKENKENIIAKKRKTLKERYGNETFNNIELQKQTWDLKSEEEKREMRKNVFKKYSFEGVLFDSSWELALWIYAKDHNEEIEREPYCFEHEFENHKHLYYPDFKYKNQLIEIKGEQFFENLDPTKEMRNPFDSSQDEKLKVKHQCMIQNNIIIWTGKDIQFALDYVKEKWGKNWYKQFFYKKD